MAATLLLEIRAICKRFPGVQALQDVSLHVDSGETLAVVGENGAGKSTMMRILAGIETPDSGVIKLDGHVVHLNGIRDAMSRGIVLIHQELNLVENLSVQSNLFLGREHCMGGVFLNRKSMERAARAITQRMGLQLPLNRAIRDLPMGQRQLVEIARAIDTNARILIMDEPTSSLTTFEAEKLFALMTELRNRGVAIIYISHRLEEVSKVADRVTVLRDGRNAGELNRSEITHNAMVRLMVGRQSANQRIRASVDTQSLPIRLTCRELRFADGPKHAVSFNAHGGEIVGIAGLVGSGRTEIVEAIFGLRQIVGGEIIVDHQPVKFCSPRDAIRNGILLCPEDRRHNGLFVEKNVQWNIALPNLLRLSSFRLISRRRESSLAIDMIKTLAIKTRHRSQAVKFLSGGNQQKVMFGKWLARGPKILLLDEPTRGVDIGAREEIYALMDQVARKGVAILLVSSDIEELQAVCDRILVMHQGRLAGELTPGEFNQKTIMRLATGG